MLPLAWSLLGSCHPLPSLIVTALTAFLCAATDLGVTRALVVTVGVLLGQLCIGWDNDLTDAERDALVGRRDKPLALDAAHRAAVRTARFAAGLAGVVVPFAAGFWPGLLHAVLVMGSGLAYNRRLKSTVWSWLPFAVAFGGLPSVVTSAGGATGSGLSWPTGWPVWAPVWVTVTAALLGVAAHALNVLPDLADDAATGVRGLGHHLGERGLRLLAVAAVTGAAAAVLAGARPGAIPTTALVGCVALTAAVALRGRGGLPFLAVGGLALLTSATMLTHL